MEPVSLLGVDVLLFLAIGLLAGAHCIGMCGPLVTIYASAMDSSARGESPTRERSANARSDGGMAARGGGFGAGSHLTTYEVRQHALFNLGRTASYTLLGAAFGALGGAVFVGTSEVAPVFQTARGVVGVLVGALVVAMGVYYALGRTTGGVSLPGAARVSGWLAARVDRLANGPGIVGLGAVHGLLPCPILYPAFLYAFAIGSPAGGALALAALGIGTVPAVFAYGTLIESVGVAHRRRVHRLLGLAFVVLGYVLLAHGLMSLGYHIPHPSLPFYDGLGAGAGGHGGH